MAHFVAGSDQYRDLPYDDDHRSYLITQRNSPGEYRFGRMPGKRVPARGRTALSRLSGYLKTMIEAFANSKMRRTEREFELRGIRYDRPNNSWVTRNPGARRD
jgi:hypothetical protein